MKATPREIVDAANTGRSITAKITRVSGQLDPRTRTMLVEVVLDNQETASCWAAASPI